MYLSCDQLWKFPVRCPNIFFPFLILLIAETMQRNCEASVVGLQSKGYPYTLQHNNGTPSEGFLELKDENYAHPGGDIVEPDHSSSSESLESSKEFYKNPPCQQHEFGSWVTFHPESNNVHLCQLNAFEGQIYPFPVDNRFQYAPFNMFHQSYPYEYQFQDFHYFVVIDFEATCDKAKNPHPQEIIEFPSVIVSSMTGQLEACFQTYVRPTCNQLLSDFCKDLTGIQQIQVCSGFWYKLLLFFIIFYFKLLFNLLLPPSVIKSRCLTFTVFKNALISYWFRNILW